MYYLMVLRFLPALMAATPAAGRLFFGNNHNNLPRSLLGESFCTYAPNTTCYPETGWPACCQDGDDGCPIDPPQCVEGVSATAPDDAMGASVFPGLTLPEGGLRDCNEAIQSDFPNGIIPKDVIWAILNGIMQQAGLGDLLADQLEELARYDVRAHKICTSCEEIINVWDENTNATFASEVMPYCTEGSFASRRTISGLLLEPIDPVTKEPIVGKIAATINSFATEPDPFLAPSEIWPTNPATNPPYQFSALAAASAGTYTIIPDVLGNGEDWQSPRSYIVKKLYQASAVPLLLKVKGMLGRDYSCTELDKRINLMGFSEGGYATVAIADAIDMLNDDYEHMYTGVGGAPIQLASKQMQAVVEMYEGTYEFPQFVARLGNAYSSTNIDMSNTGMDQELASDDFLGAANPTRDVIEWSKAGLNYTEMVPFLPFPPDERMSDTMNQDFVETVIASFGNGNTDPCNSEYKVDGIDKLCDTVLENNVLDELERMEYPVVICHSREDQLIYFSNVPDLSEEWNDNLIMIEDTPAGEVVKPSGDHANSGFQCLIGFLFPFMEISTDVRSIMPLDDGVCGSEQTTGVSSTGATSPSTTDSGRTEASSTTTTSSTVASTKSTTAAPKESTPSPTPQAAGAVFGRSSLGAVSATAIVLWSTVNYFGGLW